MCIYEEIFSQKLSSYLTYIFISVLLFFAVFPVSEYNNGAVIFVKERSTLFPSEKCYMLLFLSRAAVISLRRPPGEKYFIHFCSVYLPNSTREVAIKMLPRLNLE